VVAAAVTMAREVLESGADNQLSGINDSKQLTPRRRLALYRAIHACRTVRVGVGEASVEEIDRLNILRATHLAMRRALRALGPRPDHVLVDGRPVPGLVPPATFIVRGDAQSLLIAAASIVAKVDRDGMMERLDRRYPGYGLARHKGYATPEHLRALEQRGPCPCHRRSFDPVAQLRLDL
jgi:ribonuclease HII